MKITDADKFKSEAIWLEMTEEEWNDFYADYSSRLAVATGISNFGGNGDSALRYVLLYGRPFIIKLVEPPPSTETKRRSWFRK